MSAAVAIATKGESFSHCQKLVPTDDRTLAEQFAAVVLPFSIGQLARAAQCSKDTAKAWRAGRALPGASNLFKLARALGPVRLWAEGQIDPSKDVYARLAELQQQALLSGEEGAIARAKLNDIMAVARGA